MLVIRMQRTGRKGHAQFRVVVQDSRRTPTSGKVVAAIGSYDPHAKTVRIDKDKAAFYMEHGAQPSDRVARMLKAEGVKLPDWVTLPANKERTVRNADKRRSTMPPAPKEEAPAEAPAAEEVAPEEAAPAPEAAVSETPEATEAPAEEAAAEATEPEVPAEEAAAEAPAIEEVAAETPADAEEATETPSETE